MVKFIGLIVVLLMIEIQVSGSFKKTNTRFLVSARRQESLSYKEVLFRPRQSLTFELKMADTNGAASTLITSISSIFPKISFLMTGVLALSLIWTTLAPSKVYADSKFPVRGDESIMSQKEHGTSNYPVQENLRWKVDNALADRIVNFNRRYAEYSGYWSQETELIKEINDHIAKNDNNPIQFYDSVTGKLIFTAPIGRTYEEFKEESLSHGWPSFRDNEVKLCTN